MVIHKHLLKPFFDHPRWFGQAWISDVEVGKRQFGTQIQTYRDAPPKLDGPNLPRSEHAIEIQTSFQVIRKEPKSQSLNVQLSPVAACQR
eukprot:s1622_g2.t1